MSAPNVEGVEGVDALLVGTWIGTRSNSNVDWLGSGSNQGSYPLLPAGVTVTAVGVFYGAVLVLVTSYVKVRAQRVLD